MILAEARGDVGDAGRVNDGDFVRVGGSHAEELVGHAAILWCLTFFFFFFFPAFSVHRLWLGSGGSGYGRVASLQRKGGAEVKTGETGVCD